MMMATTLHQKQILQTLAAPGNRVCSGAEPPCDAVPPSQAAVARCHTPRSAAACAACACRLGTAAERIAGAVPALVTPSHLRTEI